MFKQWRVKFKLLVLSFTQRLVVADSVVFQIPPLLKKSVVCHACELQNIDMNKDER
jgi:hypothetical protein